MFVCRDSLILDKVKENGYVYATDFFSGNIDGKPLVVSWNGNASLDWNKISDVVHDDNVDIIWKSVLDYKTGGYHHEIINHNFTKFNFMLEECAQIENISQWMLFYLGVEKETKFLVFDPFLHLSYRQSSTGISGDIMSNKIGETYFLVKTKILKKRPEKHSCKQYQAPNGYKKCVENIARRKLVNLSGCIPPWMSQLGNEKLCYHKIEFSDEKEAEFVKSQLALFVRQASLTAGYIYLHLDIE